LLTPSRSRARRHRRWRTRTIGESSHRDIKPENILLTGGEALVAGFGIARAVTAVGGSRLTEPGAEEWSAGRWMCICKVNYAEDTGNAHVFPDPALQGR
jgi:serine/threonine protein kinase